MDGWNGTWDKEAGYGTRKEEMDGRKEEMDGWSGTWDKGDGLGWDGMSEDGMDWAEK